MPRARPAHVAAADEVGEAHLLADAEEKARAEIAARFVDEFERGAVGAEEIDAGKADHQHGLLLVLDQLDLARGGERGRLRARLRRAQARRRAERAERFLDERADFLGAHIAEDGEHAVARDEVAVAEGERGRRG